MENKSSRYYVISEKCQLFKPGALDVLPENEFRQIWRNQLLGESILIADNEKFKNFTSLTIFPKGNLHFVQASREYMEMLINNEDRFASITYEDFLSACKTCCPNEKYSKWIDYLEERYIVKN